MEKKAVEIRIGKNLNSILYDKKLSQKQVAEAAGVTEYAISRLVNGEKMVSVRVLERVADFLGVSIDRLLK